MGLERAINFAWTVNHYGLAGVNAALRIMIGSNVGPVRAIDSERKEMLPSGIAFPCSKTAISEDLI